LDATKTSAKLADGILQVEISKREEAKPRRIKLS
jgi:HSP20 family molecular chaperone IbpA